MRALGCWGHEQTMELGSGTQFSDLRGILNPVRVTWYYYATCFRLIGVRTDVLSRPTSTPTPVRVDERTTGRNWKTQRMKRGFAFTFAANSIWNVWKYVNVRFMARHDDMRYALAESRMSNDIRSYQHSNTRISPTIRNKQVSTSWMMTVR
jgi:hypothetical protein